MLELDQLSRRYGDTVALDELSFKVGAGEVVGFLGPNGAGKTTAMRAVLGIVRPDAGSVRWRNQPVSYTDRLRFGYMPEERGLYMTMRVMDQLLFLAQLHGMEDEAARASAHHWLSVLGLDDRADDRLDALSMGNQQRVQMAAALVHSPDLLVLDEPFSGLDPTGIEALSHVLAERAQEGAAVVFSSHQLDLVEHMCERVVIINRGRLVISGMVDALTTSDRMLEVAVEGDPEGRWVQQVPGVHIESTNDGTVRVSLGDDVAPDAVLGAARSGGQVRHFSVARKRLSQVFREAVRP